MKLSELKKSIEVVLAIVGDLEIRDIDTGEKVDISLPLGVNEGEVFVYLSQHRNL